MNKWIMAGLIGLASMQAQAGFLSGNTLYAYMTSGNTFESELAIGCVMGIMDANNGPGRTKHRWCFSVPGGVTGEQARDVVRRFLEQNPNKRHFEAASLTEAALAEAFPYHK